MHAQPKPSAPPRTDSRMRSELRVYYGPSQQALLRGFSVDLSSGGLFLKTDRPLDVDENLTLLFSLPGEAKTIACNVRVAWINSAEDPRKPELPPGAGLQFVDLSLEAMKAIRRFLEHNEVVPTW